VAIASSFARSRPSPQTWTSARPVRFCQSARRCADCPGQRRADSHRASAARSASQRPATRPARTLPRSLDRRCAPPLVPSPPAHRGEQGWAKLSRATHHDGSEPMHPWYENGTTGWGVVAWFDVRQAFGFARAHCTHAFRRHAFRFLPLATIPNHQRVFPLLLPGLHLLISTLPQVILHDLGCPFGGMQQVT